jgi:holo-[acyl-carrier protein] synthase
MSVIGLGTDLIECSRIRRILEQHGDAFLERLLTPDERAYVQQFHRDIVPRVAGRFAAKEAIVKVLGTGLRGKLAWRDMEILNDANGKPVVTLHDGCREVADRLGIATVLISITHTENYAAATAIGIGAA